MWNICFLLFYLFYVEHSAAAKYIPSANVPKKFMLAVI